MRSIWYGRLWGRSKKVIIKVGLCALSLLLLTACSLLASRAQEPSGSLQAKPSVKVTPAQQEENLALDMVLSDLLNYKLIGYSKRHKMLFDSKAWPTYKPQHSQIALGDLNLVDKQMEEATQNMDAGLKFLSRTSEWRKALERVYPDSKVYVSFCTLSHVSNTLQIRLRWGPSAHGAFAAYILMRERGAWKITKRDIVFYE